MRHYISDSNGDEIRTNNGERVFWSDSDGDFNRNSQTVYTEHSGIFGGSSKIDGVSYDPSHNKFK